MGARVLAGVILFLSSASVAQEPPIEGARQVLDAFLRMNAHGGVASEEGQALLTGEAAAQWKTPTVGLIQGSPDQLIRVDTWSVVARIPADTDGRPDVYFYLRHIESRWRIEAMRYLSLTGFLTKLLQELKQRPQSADRDSEIRNIELTLSSDAALRDWFSTHRSDLERLAQGIAPADQESLRKILGLHSVERVDGQVKILVGGILDNTIGFLYSTAESLPPISADEFIWIEALAEGWYLFRTT